MDLAVNGSDEWAGLLGEPPGHDSIFLPWLMVDAAEAPPPPPVFLSSGNLGAALLAGENIISTEILQQAAEWRPAHIESVPCPPTRVRLHQKQTPNETPHQSSFVPLPPPPPPPLSLPPKLQPIPSASAELFPFQSHLPSLQQVASLGVLEMAPDADTGPTPLVSAVEQLMEAVRLVECGNVGTVLAILARLNQHLPPPIGQPPLLRTAYYLKNALLGALSASSSSPSQLPVLNPIDIAVKMEAHKAFVDISPIVQFSNFTATQLLLEELRLAPRIHIIDFDIGIGSQWASFMQELKHRYSNAGAALPAVKVSAFMSPRSHHPLEIHLVHDNLVSFAAELNICFELNIISVNPSDPSALRAVGSARGSEWVTINLPIGNTSLTPSLELLSLIKQLGPKILISTEHGIDCCHLPFGQYVLRTFQSCMVLLDSIDSAGANADVANKIEHFLVQPRISDSVAERHRCKEIMPPWWRAFASAGLAPVQISNFAEVQAECLLKRVQMKGFHAERRQASLTLYWKQQELVSVSAWRWC